MKNNAALTLYITVFIAAGTALTCALLLAYPLPGSPFEWLLAAIFLSLSTASTVYVLHFTTGVIFETNTLVYFASVLLFPPGIAALIAGLGSFAGNSMRRSELKPRLFNFGMTMFYTACSSWVLHQFSTVPWSPHGTRSWLGLALAVVTMQSLNLTLVAGAVSLKHRISLFDIIRQMLRTALPDLVLYCLGVMAALIAWSYPWALGMMIIPAVALFITVQRMRQSKLQQETLAEQNRGLVLSLQQQTEELQKTVALLEAALAENQTINQSLLTENAQRIEAERAAITAYDATLEALSRALELRDQDTQGHSQNVTGLTLLLAARMGIPESRQADLRRGALLHDIGKIGIPDSILLKPSPLSDAEWEIMKRHPLYAYQILNSIEFLRGALDIPYCHHEKWDGSGYPRGLRGEEIPLAARVFAVVDVWDALRSDRPYRRAWSDRRARDYILDQSGRHFDLRVVQVFLQILDEEQAALKADFPVVQTLSAESNRTGL